MRVPGCLAGTIGAYPTPWQWCVGCGRCALCGLLTSVCPGTSTRVLCRVSQCQQCHSPARACVLRDVLPQFNTLTRTPFVPPCEFMARHVYFSGGSVVRPGVRWPLVLGLQRGLAHWPLVFASTSAWPPTCSHVARQYRVRAVCAPSWGAMRGTGVVSWCVRACCATLPRAAHSQPLMLSRRQLTSFASVSPGRAMGVALDCVACVHTVVQAQ